MQRLLSYSWSGGGCEGKRGICKTQSSVFSLQIIKWNKMCEDHIDGANSSDLFCSHDSDMQYNVFFFIYIYL